MLDDAQKLLRRVGLSQEAIGDRAAVRQALYTVTPHCDYQIFGVCAPTAAEAVTALNRYTDALGYDRAPDLDPIAGSVYIKYNPRTGLCYIDSYSEGSPGVLVSCQSDYDDGIRDTYGYLPLDLFDDVPPEATPAT